MPEGLTGTVHEIDDAAQIHAKWSNGSSLALIIDVDSFTILPGSGNEYEQAVKIHYHDKNGNKTFIERKAIAVTSGIKNMDNIICLVNTCGDDTGFEVIPEDINKWVDRIGIDYHCFPKNVEFERWILCGLKSAYTIEEYVSFGNRLHILDYSGSKDWKEHSFSTTHEFLKLVDELKCIKDLFEDMGNTYAANEEEKI